MVDTHSERETLSIWKRTCLYWIPERNTYGLFKDVGESIFYDFILSFAIFAIHFISIVCVVASTHTGCYHRRLIQYYKICWVCVCVYVCITVGSASANDAHICHVAKSATTTTKTKSDSTNMHTAQLNWAKERGTLITEKSNSIIEMWSQSNSKRLFN